MSVPTSSWPVLDDLVSRVVAARQQVAVAQAEEARLLAEAVGVIADRTERLRQEAQRTGSRYRASDAGLPLREVSLELGMALRASDRTVQSRISDAYQLTREFPATYAAFQAGRVDAGHVWGIVRAGTGITDPALRARYEQLALAAAETESPARTIHAAKAIAATLDPDAFGDRTRRAHDERTLRLYNLPDGMARLIADIPAPLGYALLDRLTTMAHTTLTTPSGDDAGREVSGESSSGSSGSGGSVAGRASDTNAEGRSVAGGATQPGFGDGESTGAADDAGAADHIPSSPPTVTAGPSFGVTPTPARPDPRSMDQARTDLLCDLLLTGTPSTDTPNGTLGSIHGTIQVTVPALTLATSTTATGTGTGITGTGTGTGDTGASGRTGSTADGPALLAGYGPIDTDLARRLAALAPGWDRVFTDPHTGTPLTVDRYRPSKHLKRFLTARDERCRTPGCSRPVHRCDEDHTIPASHGGPTSPENLANLCRRHHTTKHHTTWHVQQHPAGIIEWTSPTGRHYRDRPPASVRFVPEEPPPF